MNDFAHSALLEASLSMLVATARRQVKFAVSGMMEPFGLNPYQCWMVLLLRDRGPMSLSELAGRMWMDHPTASRLVHALQKANLLRIQPDPDHGRKVLIAINPEKKGLMEEIYATVLEYRARVETDMTPEETIALKGSLIKMILNLNDLVGAESTERGFKARRSKAKALAS